MKQFVERGLDKAGIKLIGTGDVTDDDHLNDMGDVALGVVTSHHYSAAHHSRRRTRSSSRPSRRPTTACGRTSWRSAATTACTLIYEGAEEDQGRGRGDALLAAMKGQSFESPRGPVSIDAQTRDIVQNIYIRKVEKVNGELYNVEFDVERQGSGEGRQGRTGRGKPDAADKAASAQSRNEQAADHPLRRHRLRHAAVRAGRAAWR